MAHNFFPTNAIGRNSDVIKALRSLAEKAVCVCVNSCANFKNVGRAWAERCECEMFFLGNKKMFQSFKNSQIFADRAVEVNSRIFPEWGLTEA